MVEKQSQSLSENRANTRARLDAEIRLYQQDRSDAETEKIARLKSLRLARDAGNQSIALPARPKHTRKKKGNDKPAGGSP
jgi:hypothetical protein